MRQQLLAPLMLLILILEAYHLIDFSSENFLQPGVLRDELEHAGSVAKKMFCPFLILFVAFHGFTTLVLAGGCENFAWVT